MSLPPSRPETAAELRARAAHVRQLAREVHQLDDRQRLWDFAQELEARAVAAAKETDDSGGAAA